MIFYGIYKVTNLINGKMYIGKHQTDNIDDQYLGSGKLLKAALRKYGKENFKREWIMFCENADEMNLAEKIFVDETWITRSDTYNLCLGGEGGHVWVGAGPFTGRKHSIEWRLKMKQVMSGEKNPNFGKHLSSAIRQKISKKRLGMPSPMKGKKNPKISLSLMGHHVSVEQRNKQSKSMKGKLPWNKSKSIPVLQLTLNDELIKEWPSKFEVEHQLHLTHLERVLRGERQTAGGFKWKYKEQKGKYL